MTTLLMMLIVAVHLAATLYTHHRLPRYTAGVRRVWIARMVLLVAGVAVGTVSARYVNDPLPAALAFLIGFGAVHVPAAVILFVKQERGAAKS